MNDNPLFGTTGVTVTGEVQPGLVAADLIPFIGCELANGHYGKVGFRLHQGHQPGQCVLTIKAPHPDQAASDEHYWVLNMHDILSTALPNILPDETGGAA